jgi:proteasome accessory factor B
VTVHYDDQVKPEERLWCLILALIPSQRGMSKQDIFENVRGYREEYATTGATDALNKKFDRDKDEIKSLGIPLVTSETENPADAVYSISEEDYEALAFSEAEITLLAAAGAIWRDSAHSNDAREAKMKLLANDVASDPELIDFAPRMNTFDNAYGVVAEAIIAGQDIAFPYLKHGQLKPEMRNVSPLALVNSDGRWHLLAFDLGRDAERTFLLRRIVGKVQPIGPATQTPGPRQTNEFGKHLSDLWNSLTARVRVAPGTKAAVALKNRKGTEIDGNVYAVHYLDEAVFADELCEFGADVIVLEPASLRAAVIERLERLVANHG